MDGAAADRPVVGLFGAFDTGDLGEVALRRVIEGELQSSRPDIDLVALAPFGSERPVPGDEGRPARPLPSVAAQGLGLDALIIAGDVLTDDAGWASRYAIAPAAVAERGVSALATAGTRGGAPAAAQVIWFGAGGVEAAVQSGDPVLLASRVFLPDTLRRRADLLRMCGALPAGHRLVVEVTRGRAGPELNAQLVEAIKAALRADPKLSLIVLSLNPTAPSPEGAALHVGGALAEQVHHLPAWVGLDDIAAAISGATAVVATTPVGAHLAAALGTPVAALETAAGDRLSAGIPILAPELTQHVAALLAGGKPVDITAAVTTLDGAFAELAQRLPRVRSATPGGPADPVDSALAVLQQRLVDERTALEAELSRLQAELDHLRNSPEHRIARPIREGYRRWQRRRT